MIRSKRGSAIVEAAWIYPMVVLLLAGFIRYALFLHEEVRKDSLRHQEEMLSTNDPAGLDICMLMRGKWLLP